MAAMNRAKTVRLELGYWMYKHQVTYPDGDWRSANEMIGRCVRLADKLIAKRGAWPNKRFLCNADRIELLKKLEG